MSEQKSDERQAPRQSEGLIERIIEGSIRNRFLVLLAFLALIGGGSLSLMTRTSLDAIPDLSDNQVIVFADWPGRSPQVIEDQITYPLASNMQGLPGVRAVRASSAFGFSMIYVIFNDDTDVYFARTRVLERLASIRGSLPPDVNPVLGPDGTGVGHVYWYTLQGKGYDLAQLRALQDWYLRLQLQSVPGVAEIASIGGFVRQYQVDLDPSKLYVYGVTVKDVTMAIMASNNEVGGGLIEQNDSEYAVRGRGYVRQVADLENIVIKTGPGGIPVTIKQVAVVQLGNDLRRGMLDWNGTGERVGGIVVMRNGANAKAVIDNVKSKLEELKKGLPPGVTIEAAYDRSNLIDRAIDTLKHSLIEEALIVSAIILTFLLHARSALIIILSIPGAVLFSFLLMNTLGISSNLMSLGGVAIAIGVLVDAGIVMVENAYRHLAEGETASKDFLETLKVSAKQVGRPIFFSLLIILLSFAPVFLLEGQEGKLFRPLALTKTFAMAGAAILSITLVPVLMTYLLKGKLRPESENPVSRAFIRIYRPILQTALRFKKSTVGIALLSLLLTVPMAASIGKEFMPPLDEGSLLFMPTMLPNVTLTEAKRILQVQDRILQGFPEVESVLGKVGRAETATDPAPVSMIETVINLKPRELWPDPRKPKDELISEMDEKLRIPGVSNGWTQPIINRINMLATGIRTDLGLKIYGSDLNELEHLAVQAEGILKHLHGAKDVYAERVIGGRFIDIQPNRKAIARYGLKIADLQDVISSAIGGMTLTTTVEGRERFPVRVRYARDFRADVSELDRVLVPTPSGTQVPLSLLADVHESSGPPMINSENGLLRSLVFLNVRGRDMGGFVAEAKKTLSQELKLPSGYYLSWSGQYENQLRAKARLQLVIPIVLAIILLLLYFTFHSWMASGIVVLSVPFALIGGVILQKLLGYNFSVAVWVGYIALAGIAVETGVVMLIYLNEALDRRILASSPSTEAAALYPPLAEAGGARGGHPLSPQDLTEAAMDGAVLRLRPKLMTVAAALIGLVPIMWSKGTGSDVMRPIAAPMIGGLITSSILVLIVIPVLFVLWKNAQLRRGTLKPSGSRHG